MLFIILQEKAQLENPFYLNQWYWSLDTSFCHQHPVQEETVEWAVSKQALKTRYDLSLTLLCLIEKQKLICLIF